MSPEQPQVPVSRPLTAAEDVQETGQSEDDLQKAADRIRPEQPLRPGTTRSNSDIRAIVRLFQCPLCSLPFHEVVTLPCGKSICRRCMPDSHARANITYSALRERLQGFQCPFSDCNKQHALDDCGQDVLLNKATHLMRGEMERGQLEAVNLNLLTHVSSQDPWAIAGVTSLREDIGFSRVVEGGKLVATWALAEKGILKSETEVTYAEISARSDEEEGSDTIDLGVLQKAKEATRTEMDCQVCYALFYDPLTTSCGHTFCRSCLHRILDHSRYCPICRRKLGINPLLNRTSCPSNESISKIIQTFWWDELVTRREIVTADAGRHPDFDTSLFVCTLAFPLMPTLLHVFEPRYRLMIRRALDNNRTFGMVLPKRPESRDDPGFHEFGTLLRIVNVQFYPDGRSLIETVGLSRFKVLEHGSLDGYIVGKVERIDDVSLEDEEAMEATEVVPETHRDAVDDSQPPEGDASCAEEERVLTAEDLETMSTRRLMESATRFVSRMSAQSVPWLTERMLAIYGECPDDPAVFPWWFASMLPVRDAEKYKLLGTSSVRDRLKICCSWIVEWETSRWSLHDCTIL